MFQAFTLWNSYKQTNNINLNLKLVLNIKRTAYIQYLSSSKNSLN